MNANTTRTDPVDGEQLGTKRVTKQEFAKRLYETMVSKGWTQSELSRATDVGRDSISNYIRGISLPNPRNLKKLADGLGVEMSDLYPNFSMSAAGMDVPSIQTRALPGDTNFMYLEINCKLPTDVALEVQQLIIKNLK